MAMIRPPRLPILAAIVALLLLAGCGSAEPPPPLPPDAVVLAFGDSLTFGTGAPAEAAYPRVLSGLLQRTVINAGVPGEVSSQGRQRLLGLIEQHQPRLVVLIHGGNDLLRRQDPRDIAANLRAMVAAVRDSGADVVLLGVPAPSLILSAEDFYEDIALEAGIPYDGDVLPDILGDSGLKSDPFHPNADGYRRLAEAVQALITGG